MALARTKTWVAGEILFATDLNAEFSSILNNAISLISPLTAALDADGKEIILDGDGDTSITADTDDQIDFKVAGADDFQITANKFDVLAGSTLKVTGVETLTKGADVASATDLLVGIDGNIFDITGTTTIETIATKGVGTVIKLHFDAILTLTHHATNLILPGGANITTAAGDEAEFYEYASADWRCTKYTTASGQPVTQIATASIENLAVDTAQLAADAVTTIKITDANVTGPKIAMGSDARGDILYRGASNYERLAKGTDGQFLKIGANDPVWADAAIPTLETLIDATNGGADDLTEVDFTGIASTIQRITILFDEISTTGSDDCRILLGDAGGFETSGYVSTSVEVDASPVVVSATAGFDFNVNAIANHSGAIVLTLMDSSTNLWVVSGQMARDTVAVNLLVGKKALSAILTQIRITTVGGSDTFDNGNLNIMVE